MKSVLISPNALAVFLIVVSMYGIDVQVCYEEKLFPVNYEKDFNSQMGGSV